MFKQCLAMLWLALAAATGQAADKPNIILIFTDDQGYGDVGVFNDQIKFKTPNMDRLAIEGVKFTDFYVNCAVCSGSRTALMTGCNYVRLSMPAVLFPTAKAGLHPDEITIADMLKTAGYATACVGKWHLGHLAPCLPTHQGFDRYYGIPYSNDMHIDPKAPLAKNIKLHQGATVESIRAAQKSRGIVPVLRNEEVIEYPLDQTTITRKYTTEAIRFITEHKDGPFFLYMPHTYPHLPFHPDPAFAGKSGAGALGDVLEEVDWSVGQILKTLKDLKIDQNTLVIFTSDNGPARGSSGHLRGRKGSLYEGGIRVPCMMRWPARIKPGSVCSEVAATIDLLPTFAHMVGANLPKDRKIDGKNIFDLMLGKPGAKSPHAYYFVDFKGGAVRCGPWKFYPWPEGGDRRKKGKPTALPKPNAPPVQLYNLTQDLAETTNVAAQHPEVVKKIHEAFKAHQKDLKENRRPTAPLIRPE